MVTSLLSLPLFHLRLQFKRLLLSRIFCAVHFNWDQVLLIGFQLLSNNLPTLRALLLLRALLPFLVFLPVVLASGGKSRAIVLLLLRVILHLSRRRPNLILPYLHPSLQLHIHNLLHSFLYGPLLLLHLHLVFPSPSLSALLLALFNTISMAPASLAIWQETEIFHNTLHSLPYPMLSQLLLCWLI